MGKQTAAVAMVIGADPKKGIVIFQYSAPIDRVEYSPAQARDVAKGLISRADIAEGIVEGEPTMVENVNANRDLSDAQKAASMRSAEAAMQIRDLKPGLVLTDKQHAALEFLLKPVFEIVRKIPMKKMTFTPKGETFELTKVEDAHEGPLEPQ